MFDQKYIKFELNDSGVLSLAPESGNVKIFFDGDLAYTGDSSEADAPAITEPSTVTIMKTVVGSWEFYNATNTVEYFDGDQGRIKLHGNLTSPYSAICDNEIIFSISELDYFEFESDCGYSVSGIPAESGILSVDFVQGWDSSFSVVCALNGDNFKTFTTDEFTYNGLTFVLDFNIVNSAFSDSFLITYRNFFKTPPLPYGSNLITLHDDAYDIDFDSFHVFSRDKHYDCSVIYSVDKSTTNYDHKLTFKRNNNTISCIYVYSNYNIATGVFEDFVITDWPILTVLQFATPSTLPIPRTVGGLLKIKTRCADDDGYWNNRYNTYNFTIYPEFGSGILSVDSVESAANLATIFATYERYSGKTDLGTHIQITVNDFYYYLPISATGKYTILLDNITKTGLYTLKICAGHFDPLDGEKFIAGEISELQHYFVVPTPDSDIATIEVLPC